MSAKGAYILRDAEDPVAVILASGSEVGLAVSAMEELTAQGIPVRVVSVPCMELFEEQDLAYQEEVLLGDAPKLAVEAGVRFGWDRLIGRKGRFIGMNGFGASGPAEVLFRHFGITQDLIVDSVKEVAA